MTVAVVTDSTAYLPTDLATAHDISIVPLSATLSGLSGYEGIDLTPADVASALHERRASVTTSRPAPAEFAAVYQRLIDGGAAGVVSVHLSAKLSGTYDSARQAAGEFAGRVAVIDAKSAGMGVGFAVISAAAAAADGRDLAGVCAAATAAVERTRVLFYVDTLEFLRRGGRISAASALFGTALSVKPILHMIDGEVAPREKVRTASRALSRLVDLAVEAAGTGDVDLAVHHLAAPERAAALLGELRQRLGDRVRDHYLTEVGAVVAAHAGPGLAGVVVHRRI